MRNPITRLIRYFQREYPSTSTVTLGITTVGAVVATAAVIGSGGSLLLIPAAAGGFGLFATGFQAVIGGEYHRHNDGSETLNGIKIVGDKRDVASVVMAQRVIDAISKKYKHLPELPAKAQRKVMAHVKDVEPALGRIRAFKSYGTGNLTEFVFNRTYFNEQGRETTQEVARALTMGAPKAASVAAPVVAPVVEAPKPVAAPAVAAVKPAGAEFDKLSKKVDAMEKRIGDIENPKPDALDKPKLSAPTA